MDNNLANKKKGLTGDETDATNEIFVAKERIKWTGGRVWSNQIEEDPKEGIIPDGMQADRDSNVNFEEEEKSVNGEDNASKEEELINNIKEKIQPTDKNKEKTREATKLNVQQGNRVAETGNQTTSTVNPKDANVNTGDLGGTGEKITGPQEINKDVRVLQLETRIGPTTATLFHCLTDNRSSNIKGK